MKTLKRYLLLIFILLHHVKTDSTMEKEEHKPTPYHSTETKFECPTEFFRDLSSAQKPSNTSESQFYSAEDYTTFRCDSHDNSWIYNLKRSQGEYTVYPDSTRKCLPNGTWSGPRPFCVNTVKHAQTAKTRAIPLRTTKCQSSSGNICRGEWLQTGVLHHRCPLSNGPENKSSTITANAPGTVDFSFIFKFRRKIYFSFLIVNYTASDPLLNLSAHVKKEDVLPTLSQECRLFQRTLYDNWTVTHARNELECSVIQLAVYTDQLMVKYSLPQKDFHLHTNKSTHKYGTIDEGSIKFYQVLERSAIEEDDDRSTYKCPRPPIIPNAVHSQSMDADAKKMLRYECLSNYAAVRSGFEQKSTRFFTLHCVDGHWVPYPFPLCKNSTQSTSSINILKKEDTTQETKRANEQKLPTTTPKTKSSNRLTETEHWRTTRLNSQTTEMTTELPVSARVDLLFQWGFLFILGLLVSSTLTLIICLRNQKGRRIVLNLLSNQNQPDYPIVANQTTIIEANGSNRHRCLLDNSIDERSEDYHVYYYPQINGVERVEIVSVQRN